MSGDDTTRNDIIRFRVSGNTHDECLQAAVAELQRFTGNADRWWFTMDVRARTLDVSTSEIRTLIVGYDADVTAQMRRKKATSWTPPDPTVLVRK